MWNPKPKQTQLQFLLPKWLRWKETIKKTHQTQSSPLCSQLSVPVASPRSVALAVLSSESHQSQRQIHSSRWVTMIVVSIEPVLSNSLPKHFRLLLIRYLRTMCQNLTVIHANPRYPSAWRQEGVLMRESSGARNTVLHTVQWILHQHTLWERESLITMKCHQNLVLAWRECCLFILVSSNWRTTTKVKLPFQKVHPVDGNVRIRAIWVHCPFWTVPL